MLGGQLGEGGVVICKERGIDTGCSQKTVTSNLSLTDLKITKNGVTQSFLESLYPTIYGDDFYFFQKKFFDRWKWILKKSIFTREKWLK